MARVARQLGITDLARITRPGRHPCGRGLYMELSGGGTRRWVARPLIDGKRTWRSIGLRLPANPTQWPASLQLARERVQDGLDALARGEPWPDYDDAPAASNGAGSRATFGDALEFLSELPARPVDQ